MKQYSSTGLVIFFFLLLAGCASNGGPFLNSDLTQENWRRYVDSDPNQWTKGADSWFLTGEPTAAEVKNRTASSSSAISTMKVLVPDDFTNIKVDGAFQVQIFNTDEHNTVYIYGPNAGVRETAVDIRGKTLYIRQTQDAPPSIMKRVIVRIGARYLNNLTQMGCGSIEAIRISSDDLCIAATPKACGNIYLSGRVNLKRVSNAGGGNINVFGAFTPELTIQSSGSGAVNVVGNVGIKSIKHNGSGDINIIGANSNTLKINAEGKGKIGINGVVFLREIHAKDDVCVYLPAVDGDVIKVTAANNAHVGVAGCAKTLSVDTFDSAHFYGKYLCVKSAFVRAHNMSHINVTASNKAFASATDDSSVFFFGPENLLSQFASGEGAIIPMGRATWCNYNSEYRPYSYTYMHPGEAVTVAYAPDEIYLRRKRGPMNYKGE